MKLTRKKKVTLTMTHKLKMMTHNTVKTKNEMSNSTIENCHRAKGHQPEIRIISLFPIQVLFYKYLKNEFYFPARLLSKLGRYNQIYIF